MKTTLKLALTPVAISLALTGQATASEGATLVKASAPQQQISQHYGAGLIVRYTEDTDSAIASKARQSRASKTAMIELSAKLGKEAKFHRYTAQKSMVLHFDQGKPVPVSELESLAAKMRHLPGVESVQIDHIMQANLTPNDTHYAQHMWGMHDADSGINAETAWDTTNGAGVNVAVIDTGYRPHADLAANIVGGYDFISSSTVARDGNGRDADARDEGDWIEAANICGNPQARDSSWHGTHVAGTVAAVGNNNTGVIGVAYGARVVPLRVLGRCGGSNSDIADAIIWASGGNVNGVPANPNPAKVINLSLGDPRPGIACDQESQNAINIARNNGAVVVIAAGNASGQAISTPGNCNGIISVTALQDNGNKATFSSLGQEADIAAPGNRIASTMNAGTTTPGNDNYEFNSGTSMAAPHVAGVAALMFAVNPNLTPDQVEQMIKASSRPFIAGSDCTINTCGDGMLDAAAAVAAAQGGGNPPPPPPGGNSLSKGVAKTGLSGAQGSETRYTFEVPAGASNVTFNTSEGTGDVDLYVKFGSEPTVAAGTTGQCRPWRDGNVENCTFATTQAGTYHVMLHGYRSYSGLRLVADYDTSATPPPPSGNSFENTANINIPDNNTTGITSSINSTRTGQSGTVSVEVKIVHTYIGDLIVDVIHPDGTVYNVHNRTGGSADNINQTYSVNAGSKASNGEWKLRVRDRAGADTGYIDSWKITFP